METAHVLDCRDDVCPGPVIKVSKTLRTLALNQLLEVRATDPGAVADMRALAHQTGQEIVRVSEGADEVRILIRRRR